MSVLPHVFAALAAGTQPASYFDDNFNAVRDVTPSIKTTTYTTVVADHLKPVYVTGNTQINLGDASTMVAGGLGYEVWVVNTGTGTVTVKLATAANKLAGVVNGSLTIAPRRAVLFGVNTTSDGYNALATANGVFFDPSDPSKQVIFDLSGLTTGTTRTVTVPDGNVTIGSLPAGVTVDFAGSSLPSGWLECDGSAVSRATYSDLFSAIGTSWGAGDGVNTFNLPNQCGRVRIGRGTGTVTETVTSKAASGNAIPVASNNTKWVTGMQVTVSGASGYTGLTNGTWYVVRASSTTVQFATSLANAQNGTVATITGTGSATITGTLTARTLAEQGGEESHAMSITEFLSHGHTASTSSSFSVTTVSQPIAGSLLGDTTGTTGMTGNQSDNGGTVTTQTVSSSTTVNATGGNAAMNIMSPFGVFMTIIKT